MWVEEGFRNMRSSPKFRQPIYLNQELKGSYKQKKKIPHIPLFSIKHAHVKKKNRNVPTYILLFYLLLQKGGEGKNYFTYIFFLI